MAAVVRVKRRIDENPADSLVISCKRLKKSTEGTIEHGRDADELKSLFKFAATVPEQVSYVSDNRVVKTRGLESDW